jgi:nicotinate dehydrogenase subunit A
MIKLQHNLAKRSSDADPQGDLLHFLRDACADASVRFGCGSGHCGACTVLIDGQAQNACTTPVWSGDGRHIQTAQGLADDEIGRVVLAAFVDEQAAQCGYCISGILMRITGLLKHNPGANEAQIKDSLSRHLCRCGAHARILRAVLMAQKNVQHANTLP